MSVGCCLFVVFFCFVVAVCWLLFVRCCVQANFGASSTCVSHAIYHIPVACGPTCGRQRWEQRCPMSYDLMSIAARGRGLHVASG